MSTIRPDLPSNLPANPTGPSAQARAAQAAFFRAALTGVQPAASEASATTQTQTAQPATETQRLPRLGQHLDIRV